MFVGGSLFEIKEYFFIWSTRCSNLIKAYSSKIVLNLILKSKSNCNKYLSWSHLEIIPDDRIVGIVKPCIHFIVQ